MLITNLIENKLLTIINQIDFINLKNIALNLTLNRHTHQIIYQSPCCLILAKKNNLNPLLLAQQFSDKFNQINNSKDLISGVSDQGWLQFSVSDRLIEEYLNDLAKNPLIITVPINELEAKQPIKFIDYYLHARCCSLLTSAHQQEIININNLDFRINKWQITKPDNICYKLFYPNYIQEQKIIKQLLIINEKINNNKLLIKGALSTLKELFLKIESIAGIWGKTLIENRQISQARLGLIALILHYYQNIFYLQYQQTLPIQI